MNKDFKQKCSVTMEAETISKNAASPKSHTSRAVIF